MGTAVLIDGVSVAPEQATVSVFDRGFLYGDSVFETIGTYSGAPFALGAHLRRLAWSAERVLIELPVSEAVLADEVRRAVRVAANPESYVRLTLTRGKALSLGLDPLLGSTPCRVIIAAALTRPSAAERDAGIRAITFRISRPGDGTSASGAKIANYLVQVLAMDRVRAAGAGEALLVDAADRVTEGATSNVFAVKAGSLITAPEDAGILPGITRAYVLHSARARGMAIELRAMSLDELLMADEVFISSTIRELLPVVEVDGRPIQRGVPGPVTRSLGEAFRKLAEAGVELDVGCP